MHPSSPIIKWEEQFQWLKKSKEEDSAFCSTCQKSFRIDGGGIAQVKSHEKGKVHPEKTKIVTGNSSHRTFTT